jgi:hypothetical protein
LYVFWLNQAAGAANAPAASGFQATQHTPNLYKNTLEGLEFVKSRLLF